MQKRALWRTTEGESSILTHKCTQELTTKRLTLRRYEEADAEGAFANFTNDERINAYLTWRPHGKIEVTRQFIADRIADYASDSIYHWVIVADGEPIGSISAYSIDEKNCLCEVGYCLGYDWWNKGYAAEAVRAVIRFLFEEVNVYRIFAKHDAENPASGRVMQKCGMTYEGTLRSHYLRHDGTRSDALVYGILKDELV